MKSNLPSPLLKYETLLSVEKIGSFPLHIEALKDLDRTLDEICKMFDPKTPEEEEQLLDLCPYFGIVWPSARALGTFITERKSDFNKKRGIEVGAGLSLPAIVAAKAGAQMIATDFHPDVGAWVKKNASLNQVTIDYHDWDWTTEIPDFLKSEKFDFVLASDVLYEKRHPEDLVKALARLVTKTGTVYLADPGRAYLERALSEFENQGFKQMEFTYDAEESSSRPELRLEKKRKIRVFELRRTF